MRIERGDVLWITVTPGMPQKPRSQDPHAQAIRRQIQLMKARKVAAAQPRPKVEKPAREPVLPAEKAWRNAARAENGQRLSGGQWYDAIKCERNKCGKPSRELRRLQFGNGSSSYLCHQCFISIWNPKIC